MSILNLKQKKGFSLVELLVSMSLFTIVVTISVGALFILIDANNKAQNTQAVMTNLNFAIDSMAREIRTGFAYQCSSNTDADIYTGADCTGGGPQLSVVEGGSSLTQGFPVPRIAYRYNSTDNTIERLVGGSTSTWIPITSPEVDINTMVFTVTGTARTDAGDSEQPTVTIYIAGTTGQFDDADTTDASFEIQTTVTQQLIDL